MTQQHRLQGKTIFVSAAGQGIGRASAIAMAKQGARVYATDINADAMLQLADEHHEGLETCPLDVTNKSEVDRFIADIQPDTVFNCAGFVHHGTILECSDDDWDFAFQLNVQSMYHTIRAALPFMLDRGAGNIINMSSVASSIVGAPNRFIYGTTKAAVIGLTKSVAKDYVASGIRANCICPGTVDSPSLQQRLHDTGDYDAALKQFIARQPMGRLATVDEIASLVVYLASDESGFTTGQTHIIDGGWAS
ncbi:NAD(P)-dependent oxidoreductase [Amylibacter ulvae]|uniref:NAD(P)-dependent oxidoreductase n=1 Tax=Paramylibacter ulvae TaxID=1651968 RepID=A0ABQ3D479_9RHOB|nr:SDR family oxidoreductase [Amylibacter ulvae]GHA55821.1 NAD(P)-dependent oxidoreductase [Amylibacter ulvae]